jgi:hypothetical protein
MKASAWTARESVASPYNQTPAAPRDPTSGPASAICASRQAFGGIFFSVIAAPRNGMKTGALTGSPCRLASSTWPISCTKSRMISPIPKTHPPSQT